MLNLLRRNHQPRHLSADLLPKSPLLQAAPLMTRVKDDAPMIETVIDMAQYLGTPIRPCAFLANGYWTFDPNGSLIVAHDLWEQLKRPISEVELLTDYVE